MSIASLCTTFVKRFWESTDLRLCPTLQQHCYNLSLLAGYLLRKAFGNQHVGIGSAKYSCWRSSPMRAPNASNVVLQWNIGLGIATDTWVCQ